MNAERARNKNFLNQRQEDANEVNDSVDVNQPENNGDKQAEVVKNVIGQYLKTAIKIKVSLCESLFIEPDNLIISGGMPAITTSIKLASGKVNRGELLAFVSIDPDNKCCHCGTNKSLW